MGQSKRASIIEQVLNTASGFVVAWLVWMFVVAPLWQIPYDPVGGLGITAIFTVVSVIRGYLWRRLFNHYMVRAYVRS
jgi:hypothetical protein